MHTDSSRIGVVILAAGASTRLGQPKQLLRFQGETLLRRSARVALALGMGPVIVVLGAGAEGFTAELADLPLTTVVNTKWEEGMASSLRTGIGALTEFVDAAIVMLCDQPLVTKETLGALVDAYQQQTCSAVASVHASGALGPPCLFDCSLFPDLLALQGQQGAKQIFSRLPAESIAHVPFPDGTYDIDTAEDWERMQQRNSANSPA